MISVYRPAADLVAATLCLCGGFVQEGTFVHADKCERAKNLETLRDLKAEVRFVHPGSSTPPHWSASVVFDLRWSSSVDVVRNRKGQLRSLIRTRGGSRIILNRDEHAALRYAGDAILRHYHTELYQSIFGR